MSKAMALKSEPRLTVARSGGWTRVAVQRMEVEIELRKATRPSSLLWRASGGERTSRLVAKTKAEKRGDQLCEWAPRWKPRRPTRLHLDGGLDAPGRPSAPSAESSSPIIVNERGMCAGDAQPRHQTRIGDASGACSSSPSRRSLTFPSRRGSRLSEPYHERARACPRSSCPRSTS